MHFAANVRFLGNNVFERAFGAARHQLDELGQHYFERFAGADLDERLFRHMLALSRLASQYGSILEELNDPHFEVNLREFRGEF